MAAFNLRTALEADLKLEIKRENIRVTYRNDASGSVVFLRDTGRYITITAFLARSSKPYIHYKVANESAAKIVVNEFIRHDKLEYKYVQDELDAKEAYLQQALKESGGTCHHLCKVGDVFVQTYGYEQTNVNFYQVVKITKKQVVVRQIKAKLLPDDGRSMSMAGLAVAEIDSFEDDHLFRVAVSYKNSITVNGYHAKLAAKDEKGNISQRYTSWA